jgi:hypothetical protein
MFHEVFFSALSTVVKLALAMLPAAPLRPLNRFPASSPKNICIEDQGRATNPGQQASRGRGVDRIKS